MKLSRLFARASSHTLSLQQITLSVTLAVICCSAQANAQPNGAALPLANISGNAQISTANFLPGMQGFSNIYSGPISFAGQEILCSDFQGVFGMSSDIAYIMVSSGSASIGGKVAKAGRIIMIPPFGDGIAVERFDAAMFLSSLSDEAKAVEPNLMVSFSNIARGQKRGKFWGALRATGRNVNALRSISKEKERRDLLDNKAMAQVRFSGLSDDRAASQKTAQIFVGALMSKDVKSVAALLDPIQFGGMSMRGGGKEARLLAARKLVGNYDPPSEQVAAGKDEDSWIIDTSQGQKTLKLRRIDDLYFIHSIS